jgi:hypothetical protein
MKAGGGVWWPMTGRGWCFSGNGDQPRVVLGVPTLVGAVTTFQGIRCTQRNNNNNITACPPMVSIPHQWLCLLWSKPRKNYEL